LVLLIQKLPGDEQKKGQNCV